MYEKPVPKDVSYYDPIKHGARCDICPLKGQPFVPPDGKVDKPRLIIVGMEPGRKEEVYRRPFIGLSGQLLNETLEDVKVDRDDCYVTNAALCRAEVEAEGERAAECCAPRLLRELSTLPKDVPIAAMGKTAARSILGVKGIFLARGFVWTARSYEPQIKQAQLALRKANKAHWKKREAALREAKLRLQVVEGRDKLRGRTVLPMLHPAFILRSEVWTPVFRVDLDRAARLRITPKGLRVVRNGKLHKLDDEITRARSWDEFVPGTFLVVNEPADILRAGKMLKRIVASDIETRQETPLSPMRVQKLCGCVSDGERTFVIANWTPEKHAAALTEVYRDREVWFHNGFNFDQIREELDGVDFSVCEVKDTLIAHHTFNAHLPQKLDQVVSVFCDARPWKIVHGRRGGDEKGLPPQDMPEDDLWWYNAQDGVLTCISAINMQPDLRDELAVFQHDLELSKQGKRLQINGYRIDVEKKEFLSDLLKKRAAYLKGRMRKICNWSDMTLKPKDIRKALFGKLRAPMLNPTPTGLASTNNATLEALRKDEDHPRVVEFCEQLLLWRVTTKIKSTYVDAIDVHGDSRVHYNWRPYGTVSGRYACRVLSAPRWSTKPHERVREIYSASPGHWIVYFDLSQAEMRMAAHLSNDPNFVKTCEGDVHAGNAWVLFPKDRECIERDPKGKNCPQHGEEADPTKDCNCGKPFRDVAKNMGFAVLYKAEVEKVFNYLNAEGMPTELSACEEMLDTLHSTYVRYYEYIDRNVAFVKEHGYLRSCLVGRLSVFGFNPKPTDVANRPIQGGIADIMNVRLMQLEEQLDRECPGTRLIHQHYDAAHFDTPDKYVEIVGHDKKGKPKYGGPVIDAIEKMWKTPVHLEPSIVCDGTRDFLLPADIKVGRRWSEL